MQVNPWIWGIAGEIDIPQQLTLNITLSIS